MGADVVCSKDIRYVISAGSLDKVKVIMIEKPLELCYTESRKNIFFSGVVLLRQSRWEVRTETGDTQRYAVRKKGFELYDVPMTEYLDISDSIKKELGYTTGRIALAMASYRPKAVKYYLHPMGDVNTNGDVDIADAQLALQEYCNVVVAKGASVLSEEQRKLADVVPRQYWNDDNEALMMDAQTTLMYYAESLVDLNILNISMDEWAEIYYRDMVLD